MLSDAVVLVYLSKLCVKYFLGDVGWKDHISYLDADDTCALCGASFIGEVIRTLADSENAERRSHAGRFQLFYILLHLSRQSVSNRFTF